MDTIITTDKFNYKRQPPKRLPFTNIIPFPIIQMLTIAKRKDLMGILVNKGFVRFLDVVIAIIIIVLNLALLYLTVTGQA
jgi:Mn2+/Fe2+ NRAMP family transporter